MPFRPKPSAFALLLCLLCAAASGAAPHRLVVSSGDCRDAELSGQSKAFYDALRARPEQHLLTAPEFAERLFPDSSRSFEDLQRQLDAAQDQFYEGRNARAIQLLDDALSDIRRLPPGAPRWKLFAHAQLLHGLNHRAMGKTKDSDAAFLQVLRLQPKYQLDPDQYAPSIRQAFEKLRRDLAKTQKVKLSLKSTLPAADVYLEGLSVGQTPLTVELPAGAYELTMVKGDAVSFPRQVQAQGADTPLLVDLAYEGSVTAAPFPCLAAADGNEERTWSHAVRLGGTLGVEEVIVVRLERPSSGPKWFAATVLNVDGGQKLREGGFKTQGLDAPGEALSALVDFVTTGRSPSNLVVMNNANGKAPWDAGGARGTASASGTGADLTAPNLLSEDVSSDAAPSTGLRTASYVTVGAGVAALGGAGVVRLLAQKDLNGLEERRAANGGQLVSTDARAVALRDSLVGKSHVMTGLLVGGGAAVVTGAVLFLVSSPAKPAPVTLGVTADETGAAASVSGTF
ncbi:PEGA domain-containing protein [Corallococcus sp. AB032C]|uniref:PEGA domain-containing protein n=1 Tax=Corallococcus TaxID=83461 RepID=UPI000EDA73B5|nr:MULTISPECIES: PEGA domain-containing protein [Corallococcus]NNB84755.1 PEGA domain-containing protein [Corallococcus exiguus]NPC45769.1 PEGA domain-containing protein [Corallococcus exiguus]RKH85371.1 PEGA domain-containing protein [Corallococcus sp. AB032C]